MDDAKVHLFDPQGRELGKGGKPPPAPFKINSFADLSGTDVAPLQFLIAGLIPERAVTGLYGRGSIGKTMLCLQMAEAIATRAPFMGLPTVQGSVLAMLNEDDTDEINRRVKRFKGCSPDAYVIEFADVIDPCLMRFDARTGEPLWSDAARRLEATIASLKPSLVILDPIGFIYGGNENDRTSVSTFVRWLALLCVRYGCSIMIVGHPAKADGSEYSGSTAWDSAVRSRLLLKKDENGCDDEYRLLRPKSNYAPRDDEGLHIVQTMEGTFLPASMFNLKDKKARAREETRRETDSLVMEFCRHQMQNNGLMPNRSTGKGSAHGLINAIWPDRIGELRAGVLADAVTRLVSSGALVEREYTDGSRHKATRLEPV